MESKNLRLFALFIVCGICATKVPFVQQFFQDTDTPKSMRLGTFSWDNCGYKGDLFEAVNFTLSPDPVVLPGQLIVGFAMRYLQNFGSPLKASVLIAKKVGATYVKIPCIGQFGTCEYDDFCEILDMIPGCPPPLPSRNISCTCPFAKGNYSMPPTLIQLYSVPLLAGDYHGRINLSTTSGSTTRHVGCYEIYITLQEQ